MNIIIEGPDATGKTTLAKDLSSKYGFEYIHSTAETPNTYEWHKEILDKHNIVCDRFFIGETIYPIIYNRKPKMSLNDLDRLLDDMKNSDDLIIVMYASDMSILKDRLIERGEMHYLEEIDQQNELFYERYKHISSRYKNTMLVDVSRFYTDPYFYNQFYYKVYSYIENTFNYIYRDICRDLVEEGLHEDTTSNKGKTLEINNYTFTIPNIDNNIITLKSRMDNNSILYLIGEMLWYWEARNDLSFISKFSSFWSRISDDGKTSNSAYGYILKKKHGFNQIEKAIELLKKDKYSRRAVLNINVPNKNVIETKDEMCTIALIPFIRDNKLNMTCVMRSNDINFGLTYDLMYFTQLQKYIAREVGVETGSYTHLAVSIHCYLSDLEKIKSIAYGNLEESITRINLDKLIENKDILIGFVDNSNPLNKETFTNMLYDLGVLS